MDITRLRHRRGLFPCRTGGARLTPVEPGEHLAQLLVLLDQLLCKLTPQRSDLSIEVGHLIREGFRAGCDGKRLL